MIKGAFELQTRGAVDAVTGPAAVLVAPRRIELWQQTVPPPGPGHVRVRLEGCGVCASNLPLWQGRDWFDYPREPGSPGHEGWGVIDAVGEGVTSLAVGRRVAFLSSHAYAAYDLADAGAVVPLPPELDGRPFPAEPLGCVVNILCRATVRPGDDVAVVGVGFLGAMLVQACARAGARVFAVSRREESLDVAKCMGAAETMRSDDAWAVVQAVKRVTNGRMLKTVIECTGLQGPLDLAGELVGERGRLVIAGYHQDGLRQVNLQQWNWKGIDVINAHERDPAVYRAGMEAAIVAVVEGRMNPETLYTHKLPLDRLALAFQLMEERPAGFMKALLTYDTP